MLLLEFKLSCGKSVKYRYIEFFAFDYDSLPISFQSGLLFPLVALDKIYHSAYYIRLRLYLGHKTRHKST